MAFEADSVRANIDRTYRGELCCCGHQLLYLTVFNMGGWHGQPCNGQGVHPRGGALIGLWVMRCALHACLMVVGLKGRGACTTTLLPPCISPPGSAAAVTSRYDSGGNVFPGKQTISQAGKVLYHQPCLDDPPMFVLFCFTTGCTMQGASQTPGNVGPGAGRGWAHQWSAAVAAAASCLTHARRRGRCRERRPHGRAGSRLWVAGCTHWQAAAGASTAGRSSRPPPQRLLACSPPLHVNPVATHHMHRGFFL